MDTRSMVEEEQDVRTRKEVIVMIRDSVYIIMSHGI